MSGNPAPGELACLISGITGMDRLEFGSEEHRDCMRDVLAMLEQVLVVQSGLDGENRPEAERDQAREFLTVLVANANLDHCLTVALSMLASSWQLLCHLRAQARGTSVEQELTQIIATFRERLS